MIFRIINGVAPVAPTAKLAKLTSNSLSAPEGGGIRCTDNGSQISA